MYNTVTEELIKRIPHVEGFEENLLPVTLTTIYAKIISLSAKYKDGEIPFDLETLKDDRKKLNILSNTLELYLFANPNSDRKKSIAFVAATARKLLFKIKDAQEDEVLDLNYIPSDLYASLLYVISGNFADAQEVAEGFSTRKETDKYINKLYKAVKLLVNGNLTKLHNLEINEPIEYHDLQQYTQQLFWKELVIGIKRFSTSLLGEEKYLISTFLKVHELSVYEDDSISLRDVYVAPYILSTLLILSCEEMWKHAVINVTTPAGVEENGWKDALKKQAEVRPFLWDNHLEAINNGILNIGVSSVITYPTGAGKTTITNLINRFYDVQDGKIRYDGININKIKKADLRHSLGVVLQDTHLFTGTIMENIRFGRLDASDEDVINAAKLVNADEFISHLPDGYNTMLTADGSELSQGQCQLLSIARAAVADPPVLILDEATSSIDTRTEMIVQNGMDALMKGRTVFVIAHRLSTIRNSNAIIVLDHGRIIERGDHDELIAKHGTYYQLYTGALELD